MALFNSFTFGDVNSEDYGVYISGDSVYDSPARSVDLVQVPGRNGALALDNGYYENIEVTYPAGSFGTSQEEWREKMLGIRNALAAQRGYQRLIDTYHPEHYRLGMFFAGISASPVQYNRAGQFPIRFNCKPQRFLISGDEAVEFTAEGQEEVYGPANIASFEAEEGAEIRQLEVDLEPVQDLNGYDNPWPAGGGKNILPHSGSTTTTNGITFTMNADGTVTASGTATAQATFTYNNSDFITSPSSGTYYFNGNPTGSSTSTYRMRLRRYVNGSWGSWVYYNVTNDAEYTITDGTTRMQVEIHVMSGQTVSNLVFKPMLRSTSYTDASFAPYSNICPISGHTEVNVYRTGKNLLDPSLLTSPSNTLQYVEITLKANTAYTLSTNCPLRDGAIADLFFMLPSEAASSSENGAYNGKDITLTTGADGKAKIGYRLGYRESSQWLAYTKQVELGSTATAYEPYAGQTYNVPLGQTVYGGTLNVVSGLLTVNKAMADLGALNWSYSSSLGQMYTTISDMVTRTNASAICSMYSQAIVIGWGELTTNGTFAVRSGNLHILDTAYTNAADFKAAMSGVPFVYELATPQTYQLTPSAVSALLGQNNIWSDSGEVEVEVASPVDLTNPTNFPAKPLIRVYGNGSVQVGNTIATVQNNADSYVDIDCESMNCYDTTGGRNADVSFSGNDFPELASGDNGILLTGPSRVEITPRWWEL